MDPTLTAWLDLVVEPTRTALIVVLALGCGLLIGVAVGMRLARVRQTTITALARELHDASEDRARMATEAMLDHLRLAFGGLAAEALGQSSNHLLDLAEARLGAERDRHAAALDQRKALIDQEVGRVGAELDRLRRLVVDLERERARGLGEVTTRLDAASQATLALADTTQQLRDALKSSQRRGQWGERLAEDVLRHAGLVEGVSYVRQRTLGTGGRPDFTFLLPRGLRLHMDVKFPLDNYLRYAAATTEAERNRFERAFMADVRAKVRELAARSYGGEDGALDYVLLFIPNEPLAGFVFERRPELVDEALAQRVVPCAPATLFAILAVVRQAVDNFIVTEAAGDMLHQLERFDVAWSSYVQEMNRLGRKLDEAQDSFRELVGTRARSLERPLTRLAELRRRGPDTAGED
ncbi:MAG: DNA recombination protein RmuC [Pseudomonadota bacterium]